MSTLRAVRFERPQRRRRRGPWTCTLCGALTNEPHQHARWHYDPTKPDPTIREGFEGLVVPTYQKPDGRCQSQKFWTDRPEYGGDRVLKCELLCGHRGDHWAHFSTNGSTWWEG